MSAWAIALAVLTVTLAACAACALIPDPPPRGPRMRATPDLDAGRARLAAALGADPDRQPGTDPHLYADAEEIWHRPDRRPA